MKKLLPLFCTSIIVLAVACKSNDKKAENTDTTAKSATVAAEAPAKAGGAVASTDEFNISVPDGWSQQEQQIKNYRMVMLIAPQEDNYKSNLNVLKDDMKGKTLDEYISFNLQQMAPMHIKMNKSGDLDISGIKGKYLTYTYNYQGRDIAIKSYVLPKNNVAYILTGSTLVNLTDKYMPEFDKAAESFKLKE